MVVCCFAKNTTGTLATYLQLCTRNAIWTPRSPDKLYAAAVAEQLEEGRRLAEEAKQLAEDNEKSK